MTFFSIVCGILGAILVGRMMYKKNKKEELSLWEEGDMLTIFEGSTVGSMMRAKGIDRATLIAWSDQEVIVKVDSELYKTTYGSVITNKGLERRRMEARLRKQMGKPESWKLSEAFEKTKSTGNDFCDGKVIELMNEIECQVYLNKAIKADEFEVAAQIRERMKQFR